MEWFVIRLRWGILYFLWTITGTKNATLSNTTQWPLHCHKCEESFKLQWDPYTACQIYANTTPLVQCLSSEMYCKVQRTSIKGMTTNIKRECADECYYGCRAKSFGITTMTCTTCCRTPGCNTGSGGIHIYPSESALTIFIIISTVLIRRT